MKKYIRTTYGTIYKKVLDDKVCLFEYALNVAFENILKQADTIEELCDSFEVVRWDGTTFKYKSYKKAFNLWLGDGYQNVSSKMYGLINGKRVAIMTGYDTGKNPDKLELELL